MAHRTHSTHRARVSLCVWLVICALRSSGFGAEATLPDAVAAIDAKVSEARSAQEPQVRQARLREAADMGVQALEEYPETEWDPEKLKAFLKDMAYAWLSKLPKEEQLAWLGQHAASVSAPSNHLVVGFIEWKVGRRTQALARAAHVLATAPDSFPASMAMMGILTVHYHRGDLAAGEAALRSFVRTAPDNPMVSWGIRCYVWAVCRRDQPKLAHALLSDVITSKANSKAGETAVEMRTILQAIHACDFRAAFQLLESVETAYWHEMVLDDMVLTFVMPARGSAARKRLIESMQSLAQTYPHPAARPLAQCIMSMAYRMDGKAASAAQLLEQALDETQHHENPLIKLAFEGYLLSQLGRVYSKTDPSRAIPYLERFRKGYGGNAGAEFYHIALGRAYLKVGRAEDACDLFLWLEDRRKSGRTIASKHLKATIQSGLVASFDKLGMHTEAEAVAEPLLSPYGYGRDPSSLNQAQRVELSTLLQMMGRVDEAKQYRP